MKNLHTLSCIILIVSSAFGQSKEIKQADDLFNSYQYVDAITAYLKVVNSDNSNGYVYKQLADSYYNIYNVEEASNWYKKAIEFDQDAETYFRYAEMLKSQGKYEESNKQMHKFSKMLPNDQRAIAFLENPNYVSNLNKEVIEFSVEPISINDNQQTDFGAVLSNDNTLYFVSTRKKSSKQDSWTNQSYLDIFKTERNKDGSFSEPQEVKELNTFYHDGPLTLSADGKTMYFSRDGHSEGAYKKIKKNNVKLAQQGIYKATLIDGKWSNVQALPINSNDYTVTHPSISKDGKTLYFASNMPGGIGDTDIWKVSVNGNSYGKPVNLGTDVNTPGKEGFPFISDDNVLYFSSRGKQGLGGLDIFMRDLIKNEATINLGNVINTKRDDFSFSINNSKKVGYFSSNRSGTDNIYSAIPICEFKPVATVVDATNNTAISDAEVSVLDAAASIVDTQLTSIYGKANFNLKCEETYTLSVSKENYEAVTLKVNSSDMLSTSFNIPLNPIIEDIITDTEVKLQNIYFEFNKSNITKRGALELDKLVKIMKDYPDMNILVRSHTDTKGSPSYNKKLSEQRAYATVQYLISKGVEKSRLSSEGLGSNEPKINCKSNCTDEEDAQNRRSEFLIVKN